MWNFKRELYKTTNPPALPTIACSASASSGGVGVTEYIISLENPLGGIVIMDFNAQSVVDKLEILHNGIKKATTGMTTVNAGPFDDLYGSPTVPTGAEANATDQFIGTAKGTIPNRDSVFLSETGITDITRTKQQLVWFVYSDIDYIASNSVVVRVTGPSGTAWDLIRLCTTQTPIGITPIACKNLVSFDYKGVGSITFRFKYCGATVFTEHTFTGLPNSGGIYFTYTLDTEVGDPSLCIQEGSFERINGTIVNTNNFVYGTTCSI